MRRSAAALALALLATGGAADIDQTSNVLLALVDITTKDGAVVEYVAAISRAITLSDVTADGLYVIRTRPNGQEVLLPYLFDEEFVWLEPSTGRRMSVSKGVRGELPGLYGYGAYYLRDITGAADPPYVEAELAVNEDGRRILLHEKVFRARYEMLDYAPLYDGVLSALRGEFAVSTGRDAPGPARLALAEIARFALVHEPSEARLDALRAAEGHWRDSVKTTDPDSRAYTWYHDVVGSAPVAEWPFRRWRMTP